MQPGLSPRAVEQLVLAFLLESDYPHAAFALEKESRAGPLDARGVPSGQLQRLLGVAVRAQGYEREALGEQLGGGDEALKRLVEETVSRELSLLAAPAPLGALPAAPAATRNRIFRQGERVAVFSEDWRHFAQIDLAAMEDKQQLHFGALAAELGGRRWEVFPFARHLFLAAPGELHVFAQPGLARTRVLRAGEDLGAEARCEVHGFRAFYVAQFEAGLCVLDGQTAAALHWLSLRADKLAALGPHLYALDLTAQQLLLCTREGPVALQLPVGARLLGFAAEEAHNCLVALLQADRETLLVWFAAGQLQPLGESRMRGSFARARFGADLERLLLLGESSFAVFNARLGRVEERRQLKERLADAALAGERVVIELQGNSFLSFGLDERGFFAHTKADPAAFMAFSPASRRLVELGAELLTTLPLPRQGRPPN